MLDSVTAVELRRLGRSSRWFAVRSAHPILLLVALAAAYLAHCPGLAIGEVSATDASILADGCSRSVFLAQWLVVVMATPWVTATALLRPIQRGTLDLLMMTPAGAAGAWSALLLPRLILLGGFVLTGLPVLALLGLVGGVNLSTLLTGLAITTTDAATLVCLAAAWTFRLQRPLPTTVAALVVFTLGQAVLSIAGTAGLLPEAPLLTLLALRGLAFLAAVLLLAFAAGSWRTGRAPSPSLPLTCAFLPPLRDSPLAWKELHVGRRRLTARGWSVASTVVVSLLPWAVGATFLILLGERGPAFALVAVPLSLSLVMTGWHAAGSVAGERERGTLESLLVLPVSEGEVLGAKWLAAIRRSLVWVFAGGAVAVVGAFAGGWDPWRLGVLGSILTGDLALAASLGLWASVRASSAGHARLSFVTLAALASGGVWVGWAAVRPVAGEWSCFGDAIITTLTPPALWSAALGVGESVAPLALLGVAGTSLRLGVSVLLWGSARRSLRR